MVHFYPYSDAHELNLDWILRKMKELDQSMTDFEAMNKITFDGAWDITKQYKAWTIVNDGGAGFISIQPVPKGILLSNADYWRGVVDYTATIADLQNRVVNLENKTIMDYTGDGIQYPSDNPGGDQREYIVLRVPESVNKFVDNVIGIQNESHGAFGGSPDVYGNAAIAFFDKAQVERGAIGYSRENSIQPAGYVANTLYAEIGNPFGASGTDTDFRVIATNSTNFEGTSFYPIEHISQTGATNIRARGTAGIHLLGGSSGVGVGNIADGEIGKFTIDNTGTNTYMREYFDTDRAALCYNIYTDQRDALDGTKISLIMSYGKDSPLSGFDTLNCTGQKGVQVDLKEANSNDWYTLSRLDYDGRLYLGGEYESSAGFDGTLCVTNKSANRAPVTLRSEFGTQPGLLIYNKTDSDCILQIFGSGYSSYNERGTITYSAGTVHYNTSSDYRIKDVRGSADDALEKLMQIKIYDGYVNGSDQETSFVLAHELQEVFPELVTGTKDAVDESGNAILQQVDYSGLIPTIIKAVQQIKEGICK